MSVLAMMPLAERDGRKAEHGDNLDLVGLRVRLEIRLLAEERELAHARSRAESVSDREARWISNLRRYERLCDLLARQPAA